MGQIFHEALSADILLVDDDLTNAEMLARRLRRLGYRIETCSDGAQACRLLESRVFDLVLLDIIMPGMSGLEVLSRLRQAQTMTELPVIMVTARDTSDDIVTALEYGANDYITKPVDFPVATARIHTHLLLRQTMMALAKANCEIEHMAMHDELTHIANRRHFNERLSVEVKLASRLNFPVSVVVVDVDKFKHINDNYGHQIGDKALQAIAEFLSAWVRRETDLVARLGGDEFILLLPGTDQHGCEILLATMRQQMQRLTVPVDVRDEQVAIALSFGSATLYPTANTNPYDIIHSADNAMYADKQRSVTPLDALAMA